MNAGITAVAMTYNGYLFRSRLEATWAVFLDILGVEYEYESEGYALRTRERPELYSPDFWLPEQRMWLEIKARAISEQDFERCSLLRYADSPVLISEGALGKNRMRLLCFDVSEPEGDKPPESPVRFCQEDESDAVYLYRHTESDRSLFDHGLREEKLRMMTPFGVPGISLAAAIRAANSARFEQNKR